MDDPQAALLKEYGEVRSDFRTLTDIRFRLLAILPIASGAVSAFSAKLSPSSGFVLSLFGFTVTLGLVSYNQRNNQLYDELVGRASAIERSLGLADGASATRPGPWLTLRLCALRPWRVDHKSSLGLIYAATAALWLFGVLAPLFSWVNSTFVYVTHISLVVKDQARVTSLVSATAIAASVGFTVVTYRCWSKQQKSRQRHMRLLARSLALKASTMTLQALSLDERFIGKCALLLGDKGKKPQVRRRLRFYGSLQGADLLYYVPKSTPELQAAHIVGLVTDLPPRWVFDCLTNRPGLLKAMPK